MENKYYFQDLYLKYNINILEIYKIFSDHIINIQYFLNNFEIYHKKILNITKIEDINIFKFYPFFQFKNKYKLLYYFQKNNIQIKEIDFDYIFKLFKSNSCIVDEDIITFFENNLNKMYINKSILESIDNEKLLQKYNFIENKSYSILKKNIIDEYDFFKKKPLFKFYHKIFYFKNNEQVFYLIKKYNMNLDLSNFIDYIDDIEFKMDNPKNIKNLLIHYLNNFEKIKMFLSEKLFRLLFPDFDLLFFIQIYSNVLKKNNININTKIDIYNFYYSNINIILFINKKIFYDKYPCIDLNFIQKVYLNNSNFIETEIIQYFLENNSIYQNKKEFFKMYPDFSLNIFLNSQKKTIFLDNEKMIHFIINNKDCIFSVETFLKKYNQFDIIIYQKYYELETLNNDEIIIHFLNNSSNNIIQNKECLQKIYNIEFIEKINLYNNKFDIIEELKVNTKLIINFNQFIHIYLNKITNLCNNNSFLSDIYGQYKHNLCKLKNESELLYFLENTIYTLHIHEKYVGLKYIFTLNEVIQDLSFNKPNLKKGITLIIRAKNEELNVKICIESVIDLVDEIIFVNNNSSDKTGIIAEELSIKYSHLKAYHYFLDVNKVGIQHQEAIKKGDKNTLGTYYNWCLSKANYINIIKWDADFICIRENFKQMIKNYNLRNRNDKFALWFTGTTLFIHDEYLYYNINSFYNEYRVFSYSNDFKWYDGEYCEYVEPYLIKCLYKYKINYPIFYEMKNTSINEFESRSSLLDIRDKNDYELLELLKKNNINNENLISIEKKNINQIKHIFIYTNTLSSGGSNLFIIELYNYLKSFGFYVYIIVDHLQEQKKVFQIIDQYDIFLNHEINDKLNNIQVDYYICNGFLPSYISNHLDKVNNKIIFISHSDIAYSNYYIQKFHAYFNKIITVNNYTKLKLMQYLNINSTKIYKLVNFKNNKINKNVFKKKKNIFGVISRFSEDKNIIMLLFALQKIFSQKKNQHYLCYLVGSENKTIEQYIKSLICYLNLKKYVIFEGFQEDVQKYYQLFDFIILPSVSEGCSYNILESMFYEKIMVLSDVGGNHELYPNNNCIFFNYEGIREFEKNNLYIENYHGQLHLLGYKISNNIKKEELVTDFQSFIHYFKYIHSIPSILLKKEDELKIKWNMHQKNIEDAINKAMNMDLDSINKHITKNKLFYEKQFTKKIYYESLNNIIT